MTTLTLNSKYVEILQSFGNFEEIVEQILHQYTSEQINKRLKEAKQEILNFESKYEMPYETFRLKITEDLVFLTTLRKIHPTWERDFNLWEYYVEELTEWLNHLENICKLN